MNYLTPNYQPQITIKPTKTRPVVIKQPPPNPFARLGSKELSKTQRIERSNSKV